ncbi:MAG: AAA family ATPase, partial [Novosphingobium sp.]
MAEAATALAPTGNGIRLQVAGARQEESGTGFARISRETMGKLGITEGDIVAIDGKRATAARAILPHPEDEGIELIRLDGLQRANAEVASGEHVMVSKAEAKPAQRVVFAP